MAVPAALGIDPSFANSGKVAIVFHLVLLVILVSPFYDCLEK